MYCVGCVTTMVNAEAVQFIQQADPWHCFFCVGDRDDRPPGYNMGLFEKKADWKDNICRMFNTSSVDVQLPVAGERRGIRVLSLFDGIASGQFVLFCVFIFESFCFVNQYFINTSKNL